MADPEAVNLVKEALASGKTEREVIVLMKQAGYTDEAVSEVMVEIGNRPGDETARRIAEKNRMPIAQAVPRQRPMMQPMSGAGLNKSILSFIINAINSYLSPNTTVKELSGNVALEDGLKTMTLTGVLFGAIISIIYLLAGSMMPSSLIPFNIMALAMGWILVFSFIGITLSMINSWLMVSFVYWCLAKLLGGKNSYGNFAGGFGFALSGTMIIGMSIIILITLLGAIGAGLIAVIIGLLVLLAMAVYTIYVYMVFIREFMQLDTVRAVMVIAIPIIVGVVIGLFLFGYIYSVAVNSLTGGFRTL